MGLVLIGLGFTAVIDFIPEINFSISIKSCEPPIGWLELAAFEGNTALPVCFYSLRIGETLWLFTALIVHNSEHDQENEILSKK